MGTLNRKKSTSPTISKNQKPMPKKGAKALPKGKPIKPPVKSIKQPIQMKVPIPIGEGKKIKDSAAGKKAGDESVSKAVTGNGKEISKEEKAFRELNDEIEWREQEVSKVFTEARNKGKKIGRPTKLTEPLIRDLEVLARIGMSDRAMSQSVGIETETLASWLKKDAVFFGRIKKAKEKGKTVLLNTIFGHSVKNWQSAAWLLERMHRDEFALDKQKIELTGASGGPVTFKVVYEESKKDSKPELKKEKS